MQLLQINLNRYGAAQNLLTQNMIEFKFDLACVSETASVPRSPHWFASANGLAAIFVGSRDSTLKCIPHKIGRNYIAVKCNQFFVFSVYVAPSESDIILWMSLG